MIENYVGARRGVPLHAPAPEREGAKETAQNMDLQRFAAASNTLEKHTLPLPEEFTISVEQVREHFRKMGVQKSKDTVQRWCRTGELSCQKRGVLNRYFTTETSLKNLEAKILPDMIAETAGEAKLANDLMREDAAFGADANSGVQRHAPELAPEHSGTKVQSPAAPPLNAAASSAVKEAGSDLSRVVAENAGLRDQLESKNSEIEFLREEVRAARDQRGAVVQISNRMLETLETIAVGGRLDRPAAQNGGEPVRYATQHPDKGAL